MQDVRVATIPASAALRSNFLGMMRRSCHAMLVRSNQWNIKVDVLPLAANYSVAISRFRFLCAAAWYKSAK